MSASACRCCRRRIDKQALHFEPILAIAPGDGRFGELYGELTHETIVRYVALEPANPASIWSLIRLARENARAQRSAISSEAWESLNSTWLQVQNLDFDGLDALGLSRLLRLGEGALASLPRRGVRHHAA